ncbi:hypothetical protein FH608_050895 [Nonomuraea phyllanthi]|uniref:Uncharacterized protein n=2 Tax=Nonomuraea phyllanthi TaxID=2219224 RepID=A0A5C4USG7_9ACTN|nr:hypothetical protein FH608_050895 [Nonomuraea phyllanthi]
MIEAGRDCTEVVTLLAAVSLAPARAGFKMRRAGASYRPARPHSSRMAVGLGYSCTRSGGGRRNRQVGLVAVWIRLGHARARSARARAGQPAMSANWPGW